MKILEVDGGESLGEFVDGHPTVVIDFWSPECPPCKEFLPVLAQACERHPDILFCRVNTQEHQAVAQAFDVKSIPTLVVIRDHIMIASQPGSLRAEVLEDLLGKVKSLDMDVVRAEMEKEENGGAES